MLWFCFFCEKVKQSFKQTHIFVSFVGLCAFALLSTIQYSFIARDYDYETYIKEEENRPKRAQLNSNSAFGRIFALNYFLSSFVSVLLLVFLFSSQFFLYVAVFQWLFNVVCMLCVAAVSHCVAHSSQLRAREEEKSNKKFCYCRPLLDGLSWGSTHHGCI